MTTLQPLMSDTIGPVLSTRFVLRQSALRGAPSAVKAVCEDDSVLQPHLLDRTKIQKVVAAQPQPVQVVVQHQGIKAPVPASSSQPRQPSQLRYNRSLPSLFLLRHHLDRKVSSIPGPSQPFRFHGTMVTGIEKQGVFSPRSGVLHDDIHLPRYCRCPRQFGPSCSHSWIRACWNRLSEMGFGRDPFPFRHGVPGSLGW